MAVTGKIDRKYMAHYIDASFSAGSEDYFRLGSDLEEFNIDLSPDTETGKNILGESTFRHNGYEVTAEADPYYANTEDAIFEPLQEIIDNRYKDDHCKTTVVEVHLWDGTDIEFTAYREDCYVIPTSYGGDTSGYQIPFTINYVGNRVKGKFNVSTKKFTADGSAL